MAAATQGSYVTGVIDQSTADIAFTDVSLTSYFFIQGSEPGANFSDAQPKVYD